MAAKALLTVEQFMQLPEVQDDEEIRRFELIDGEVIEVPSATPLHQMLLRDLLIEIANFLGDTGLGKVISSTDIQLSSTTLYRPDIAYWSKARFSAINLNSTPVVVIPELVIEVVSTTDKFESLIRRAYAFRKAGTHTVWIVDDDPIEIQVFDPAGRRVICAGDKLEVPDLLPGFALDPSQLVP